MALPYESATSGTKAIAEIQKILQGFGAQSFGMMDKFETGEVVVQFELRKRQISIVVSSKNYAALWLKAHPQHANHKCSKADYERRALKIGQTAVYSVLRDWIKGQITAIEIGMMSVESAFLGQIMLPSGQSVLQAISEHKILQLGN